MAHLTRLVLLLVGFSPMVLEAQVVEHQGANNPAAEGWTEFMTGSVDVGPVMNDLGLGVDSWKVNDKDTSGNRFYFIAPSNAIVDAAFRYGWSLSTNIRIVDFPDPPDGQERALPEDGSPGVHYRDGSREWSIHFGAEDNGDVIAMLMTKVLPAGQREGTPIPVSGGSSEYRTFELVYDPVSGTADLFVDGTSAFVGYEGAPFDTSASVRWGASSTPPRGHANFASVRFDIGDECPDDSDKTDPGICGCGIAETDSDADGTPDCIDECPDDPKKTDRQTNLWMWNCRN